MLPIEARASGRFVGHFHFGDLPDWKARKSLQLYADEVKPEVDTSGDINPCSFV